MNTQHHFRHICVDSQAFAKVKTLSSFLKIARAQSFKQTYYNSPLDDPNRGPNKYFGDALESFWEVASLTCENDKRINCHNYTPAKVDEFAIDGWASTYISSKVEGKLGIQVKATSDPKKYFNTTDEGSNIGNAVAGIAVHKLDRVLFVNTGRGIHPKLLDTFNQNRIIVVQLNRDDLEQLFNNTKVWKTWVESLTTGSI
jgi:hypothetical protein